MLSTTKPVYIDFLHEHVRRGVIFSMLGDTVAHTTELRQARKSYTAACPEFPGCKLPNMTTVIISGFWAMMVNDPALGMYQEIIVKREEQILRAGPGSRPIIDTLAYTLVNLHM